MKFPSHLNCDGKIVSEMVPRYDCAIDRQNYREIVTKIRSYRCYAWNI